MIRASHAASLMCATLLLGPGIAPAQSHGGEVIESTAAAGDRVRLLPNGRWEFLDPQKAEAARAVAQRYQENQGCPQGSQGGLFGVGRCIQPGDRDFNRGSLNPSRR